MTVLSLLVGGKLDGQRPRTTVETSAGTFSVNLSRENGFLTYRIRRISTSTRLKGEIERAFAKGITIIATSADSMSYWSLESFSGRLREAAAEIIPLALHEEGYRLGALELSEEVLAGLYHAAKQVLECRIRVDHDEIVLGDINIRDFQTFSELRQLGDVTEILATLESSDCAGIHLVRILKDGRFAISPETDHQDAFSQVLHWLRLAQKGKVPTT